ncbi:MAG: HAD hydrolase-like protein [Sphaerochaeta sp.]|nr:HAD hydrolase-like protein [Sphaerochaeta sp.]
MVRKMNCESVIFDLDGTLWNPMEMSLEAWKRACIEHGIDPEILERERFARAFGHPASAVAEIVLPAVEKSLQNKVLDSANEMEIQLIRTGLGALFDDVEIILEHLARTKRLFLCSNCQSGYIEAFLSTYGMELLFVDYICSGDTLQGKGINLGILIARNSIGDAVMVGDMVSDYDAARVNNLPFIYASYGFGDLRQFEAKIDRIDELLHVLA